MPRGREGRRSAGFGVAAGSRVEQVSSRKWGRPPISVAAEVVALEVARTDAAQEAALPDAHLEREARHLEALVALRVRSDLVAVLDGRAPRVAVGVGDLARRAPGPVGALGRIRDRLVSESA